MRIGSVEIQPGIMNAACSIAKTPADVDAFLKTGIGAIVIGSITLKPREPNPEPRWYVGDGFALNSFGMPNGGIEYYAKHLPAMIAATHKANKKLILSVAGFSAKEYGQLAAFAEQHQPDILELNLGCPNVKGEPIASSDIGYVAEILEVVKHQTDLPVIVKCSPYTNILELQKVVKVFIDSGIVSGVVTCNTLPGSMMFDDKGKSVLATEEGGLSGPALRPLALGQVAAFRRELPKNIAVIGVGGIETKAHVSQFLRAGANAVQAATLIVRDGHAAIDRLV
jgi:dihydroorotate dehydrogenase (fumarate)